MTRKRIFTIIALAAALMALTAMIIACSKTTSTGVKRNWTVPSGFNQHDYDAIASFLEQTDDQLVKNGDKLSYNYNVNDPSTWRISWVDTAKGKMIRELDFRLDSDWKALVGKLDLSSCTELIELECSQNEITELDVSGCTSLKRLYYNSCRITSFKASGCNSIEHLGCSDNNITSLDLSGFPNLEWLDCNNNSLTKLDTSSNSKLILLHCGYNMLNKLDVSHNRLLENIDCRGNSITSLDISNIVQHDHLRIFCDDNVALEGIHGDVYVNPLY